jgi:hypothetical protein
MRLIPKQPFVVGGDFKLDNLSAIEAERGMLLRANLATQIRDLPDGTKITFKITD